MSAASAVYGPGPPALRTTDWPEAREGWARTWSTGVEGPTWAAGRGGQRRAGRGPMLTDGIALRPSSCNTRLGWADCHHPQRRREDQ